MTLTTEKIRGGIIGVAVGDTLGKPLEFKGQDDARRLYPDKLREVVAGGVDTRPGAITDDTGMTIAVLKGVLRAGKDADTKEIVNTVGEKFSDWLTSRPPDCGPACSNGIHLFRQYRDGEKVAERISESAGGNGAIMRTLPMSLFWADDLGRMVELSRKITRLSHATVAEWTSALYNVYVVLLMRGADKRDGLRQAMQMIDEIAPELRDRSEHSHGAKVHGTLTAQFQPEYLETLDNWTVGASRNAYNGYCVDTLRIALWAFLTTDNAEDCLVETINLAGDSDSYGAVAGGLCGAYYGFSGLPVRWVNALLPEVRQELEDIAAKTCTVLGIN